MDDVSFNFGMLLLLVPHMLPHVSISETPRLPGDVEKHGQGIQIIWTGETARKNRRPGR